MFLLKSEELVNHTENIIYDKTQKHKFNLDLTAGKVHRYVDSASLDFGGSEFEPASTKTLNPKKKNPDDDYGWWELDAGTYRIEFNEQLNNLGDTLVIISPHPHLRKAGALGNTILLTSEDDLDRLTMNVHIPEPGCDIKENARIATLHILAG